MTVAIGVGYYEKFEDQLVEIARDHVYNLDDSDDLSDIFTDILKETCSKSITHIISIQDKLRDTLCFLVRVVWENNHYFKSTMFWCASKIHQSVIKGTWEQIVTQTISQSRCCHRQCFEILLEPTQSIFGDTKRPNDLTSFPGLSRRCF